MTKHDFEFFNLPEPNGFYKYMSVWVRKWQMDVDDVWMDAYIANQINESTLACVVWQCLYLLTIDNKNFFPRK